MNSFHTQFGRTIDFLPGYRETHASQIEATKIALQNASEEIRQPASFYAFAKDAFEYALMIDFLAQSGVTLRNVQALDIGGKEATASRLLKAEGFAKSAYCVDVDDFSQQLSTAQFDGFLRKLRLLSMVAPGMVRFNFQEHFDFPVSRSSHYHNICRAGSSSSELDGYFPNGLMNLDDNLQYDFVTAFLCLPYFPLNSFYEKLSRAVASGGYFYFLSDYWWSHNNSTCLIGNFPWCAQRLTEEDFLRYVKEQHPEDLQLAQQRYQYYHNNEEHPTVSDHVRIAEDHGFRLIACRRHLARANDGERHLITPGQLEERVSIADVLADIHEFRPDVCEADLRTSFISAIFVKS